MKKTLLAAALLAGYTGTALAQNSVTLYGRLAPAMVYESIKVSDDAAALGIAGGRADTYNQFSSADGYAPGGSLYGLKGVEDLGNGLNVGFKFENGLSTTTGTTTSRIAALTVSSSAWGSLGIGKDFTVGSQILAGISPLGTAYGVGSAQQAFGVFSNNVGSQLKYLSPSISGFSFGASYSFNAGTINGIDADGDRVALGSADFGTTNKNRYLQAGLRYANGPVVLGALYTTFMPADNAFDKQSKNWVLGGTYDLKAVKLHAAYGQNIDGIISGTSARNALGDNTGANFGAIGAGTLVASGRTNQWMGGLSAPVGEAGRVLFSISQLRPGGDFDTDFTSTQTNGGIAYTYSLSKRTSLYGSYSYSRNYGMIEGVTVNSIGAGVVHLF